MALTAQQLFDTVVDGLRKQGSKSLMSEELRIKLGYPPGTCAYRGMDNKKCSAGLLLLDEEYDPRLEGKGLLLVMDRILAFSKRIGDNGNLLFDLQRLHDRYDVDNWEVGFQRIAQNHQLIYTAP